MSHKREESPVEYVVVILNLFSSPGVNLYYAEFHADSRSGLHFDLGGRISEHKSNYQIEVPMKRCHFFRALQILI